MLSRQYKYTCCGTIVSSTDVQKTCRGCGAVNPIYEEVDKEDMVFTHVGFSGDKKFESREWGEFSILCDEEGYKVKKITVKPNHRLSLQLHTKRDEYWVVVGGVGWMHVAGKEFDVEIGDTVHIKKYQTHRIENNLDVDLVFIEVQMGDCKEDDIIRIEDDYGR